jgi:hypothetical protein
LKCHEKSKSMTEAEGIRLELDSQCLGLHGPGFLKSSIRIHFDTAPQVHIPVQIERSY